MARTYQDKGHCPIEYSWRAFGRWYQNVFNIMKQLRFDDNNSVYDLLIPLGEGQKMCDLNFKNKLMYIDLPLRDKISILPLFLKYFTSCDERNIKNYSNIKLTDYINDNKLSENIVQTLFKISGPYFGMDYEHASIYDLLYAFEMIVVNSDKKNTFSITKYPTTYSWFEPWEKYLLNSGVTILKNTEVKHIQVENNTIRNCVVYDKDSNKTHQIISDVFISCLPPESLYKLMNNKMFNKTKLYNNIKNVYKNGTQIQLSVYFYLNKEMYLNKKNQFLYLPDTPWLLMVLPTGHIWGKQYLRKYCDYRINEVVSIGICNPYKNGIYIQKPWHKCTKKEIEIETWYQLINDEIFRNSLCDKKLLNEIKIIDFKMWDSYKFNNKTQEMETYEPKWANNINTKKYRPKCKTHINNFFLGGGWTDTTTGLHSMESACESGKIASKCVMEYDGKNSYNVYLHTKNNNIITAPIRFIDNLIYNYFVIILLFIVIIILGYLNSNISTNK